MISMQKVSKVYPNGVVAVDDLDLKIEDGEFLYVVGPSGAGKSTFMKMIYREEKPSNGQLLIDGIDVGKLKTVTSRNCAASSASSSKIISCSLH